MATIFEKLPASGEQCLILDPKESLIYPFNIGRWSQIRIGSYISFAGTQSGNAAYSVENVAYSSSDKKNNLYFGLCSDSFSSNYNTGSFMGCLAAISNGNVSLTDGGIFFNASASVGIGTINTGLLQGLSNLAISIPISSIATSISNENYGRLLGIEITGSNIGSVGQMFGLRYYIDTSSNNDLSISHLRQQMASIPYAQNFSNFYWTSGYAADGGPLDIPENIMISSPFINNRIRIHTLLAEKYA